MSEASGTRAVESGGTRRRRSPRLPDYDYREMGVYFITICALDHRCVFGDIDGDEVALSSVGLIARDQWLRTLELRPYIAEDIFVVMPNHVHLLFGLWTGEEAGIPPWIETADKARLVPTRPGAPPPMSVPAIIGAYKSSVTRLARRSGAWVDGPLWQGRYHDRVVRNERECNAIRDYIADNPRKWLEDRFYR